MHRRFGDADLLHSLDATVICERVDKLDPLLVSWAFNLVKEGMQTMYQQVKYPSEDELIP